MEDSYLTKTPQFIKATSVNNILSESNKSIKRTKTICTIGFIKNYIGQKLEYLQMLHY